MAVLVGCAWAAALPGQDIGTPSRYGVAALEGNFRPDPHTVQLRAGGGDDASTLAPGCAGLISAERPDYELDYSSPAQYALGFFVVGEADTTLVVNDPSDEWHCNDDFSKLGGGNPGVEFSKPEAGTYDIWVGAYGEDDVGTTAELFISELGAPWEPLYGTVDLRANFTPDPYAIEAAAGGSDAAELLADGCVGFVSAARADFGFDYETGDFQLGIFAEGDSDSTLVVRDPAGEWHCNDDFSRAGGHNPGVEFADPMSGFYRVWVGAYSADEVGEPVRLLVTERGSPWDGGSTSSSEPDGDGTELVASGTGFVVSPTGHILTNHHVIDECTRTTFQLRGDLAVEAPLLSSNEATDLALLKADLTVGTPARFRDGTGMRLGDEVVVYGFPLLGDLSSQGNITNGIVSALSGLNDDLSRFQMSAQIQPGNSGGPVMDRSGHVVGVVVEMANEEYFRERRGAVPQNVNFAIRDSLARSFLDTNNVGYDMAQAAEAPLSIADIAETAQEFTGIVLCYR